MDVAHTLALKTPLTRKINTSDGQREEQVTAVNFREPKGADLLSMDAHEGDNAKTMAFAAYISDVSYAEIKAMSVVDTRAIMRVANNFLLHGLATGPSSSDDSSKAE